MKDNSRVNRYDKSIFKKFWFWIVILGVLLILIFAVYSSSAKKSGNVSDKKSTSKIIKTNKNKTRKETKIKNTNNDSLNQNKFDKQDSKQQPNSSEIKKQATANNKQNNVNSDSGTNQNTLNKDNNISSQNIDVNNQQSNNNDTNSMKNNDAPKNAPSSHVYTKEEAQKVVSENSDNPECNITPNNSNPEYTGNINGQPTFASNDTQHLYDAVNGN